MTKYFPGRIIRFVRLRSWRNRHTRTFEGRVRQRVRVQVPSTAHQSPAGFLQDFFAVTVRIRIQKNPGCVVLLFSHSSLKAPAGCTCRGFLTKVEMRGFEPLSENPSNEPSPSAVRDLFSFYSRPRTNCRISSFMITDTGAKLNRYSFPAILTPDT